MNTIPSLLTKQAEIDKQAQYDYIRDFTASTIAHLVKGGMKAEEATGFAKEACVKHPSILERAKRIAILEKTASYIQDLETQLIEAQANAKTTEAVGEKLPSHLEKLANIGFTPEEINYFSSVPNELVEKVAGAVTEPWSLGKAAGVEQPPTDPLLDFILK